MTSRERGISNSIGVNMRGETIAGIRATPLSLGRLRYDGRGTRGGPRSRDTPPAMQLSRPSAPSSAGVLSRQKHAHTGVRRTACSGNVREAAGGSHVRNVRFAVQRVRFAHARDRRQRHTRQAAGGRRGRRGGRRAADDGATAGDDDTRPDDGRPTLPRRHRAQAHEAPGGRRDPPFDRDAVSQRQRRRQPKAEKMSARHCGNEKERKERKGRREGEHSRGGGIRGLQTPPERRAAQHAAIGMGGAIAWDPTECGK